MMVATGRTAANNVSHHYVPAGLRVYAIGDVHGCLELLHGKLAAIDDDLRRRPCADHLVIFLGDYVDRGPASAEVLDLLLARQAAGRCVCLQGNHEQVFLEFVKGRVGLTSWIGMGGMATLHSYGVRPSADKSDEHAAEVRRALLAAIPQAHVDFLGHLPPFHEIGSCLFVHAGIRPGVALAGQQLADLLWIRDDFLDWRGASDHLVVHGHTPVHAPEVHANRINIDTGAYATRRLTCLVLEGTTGRFL